MLHQPAGEQAEVSSTVCTARERAGSAGEQGHWRDGAGPGKPGPRATLCHAALTDLVQADVLDLPLVGGELQGRVEGGQGTVDLTLRGRKSVTANPDPSHPITGTSSLPEFSHPAQRGSRFLGHPARKAQGLSVHP